MWLSRHAIHVLRPGLVTDFGTELGHVSSGEVSQLIPFWMLCFLYLYLLWVSFVSLSFVDLTRLPLFALLQLLQCNGMILRFDWFYFDFILIHCAHCFNFGLYCFVWFVWFLTWLVGLVGVCAVFHLYLYLLYLGYMYRPGEVDTHGSLLYAMLYFLLYGIPQPIVCCFGWLVEWLVFYEFVCLSEVIGWTWHGECRILSTDICHVCLGLVWFCLPPGKEGKKYKRYEYDDDVRHFCAICML